MYGDGILVILNCFSRPQNMPAIIAAWRAQSVPARKIVVVDNTSRKNDALIKGYELYPTPNLYHADDVWRWTENCGCPCHLAPALMLYGHKYVMFADDDFLPGRRALEHLLATARVCGDEFSTIGQVGRTFMRSVEGQVHYSRANAPRSHWGVQEMTRVDLTCRTSFVRAGCVTAALMFRQRLLDSSSQEDRAAAERLVGVHDDFLKCMGIQLATGWPSYVTSRTDDPETELVKTEIPNGPESVYKRAGHYEERQQFVDLAVAAGWRSLV